MWFSRWTGSRAARLLATAIKASTLKRGKKMEVVAADRHTSSDARVREDALTQLRALSRPLPSSFRFNRDEINERTE